MGLTSKNKNHSFTAFFCTRAVPGFFQSVWCVKEKEKNFGSVLYSLQSCLQSSGKALAWSYRITAVSVLSIY